MFTLKCFMNHIKKKSVSWSVVKLPFAYTPKKSSSGGRGILCFQDSRSLQMEAQISTIGSQGPVHVCAYMCVCVCVHVCERRWFVKSFLWILAIPAVMEAWWPWGMSNVALYWGSLTWSDSPWYQSIPFFFTGVSLYLLAQDDLLY